MKIHFQVDTVLGITVSVTKDYWNYIIEKKHRIMAGKEKTVLETLQNPDEVRKSKLDESVYLYYRKFDKLYCVVARHFERDGFIITCYPTDKVKEGDIVWTRS